MNDLEIWCGEIVTPTRRGRVVSYASSRIDFLARVRSQLGGDAMIEVVDAHALVDAESDNTWMSLVDRLVVTEEVVIFFPERIAARSDLDFRSEAIFDPTWFQTQRGVLCLRPLDLPGPFVRSSALRKEPPLSPDLAELLFGCPPVDLHPRGAADWSTFAVIEAARHPLLPELIEVSGLDYACLFDGQLAEDAADVAPYIVELKAEHRFTKALFADNDSPSSLWRAETGILIRSSASLASIRGHLRHFTRTRHHSGAGRYFRFHDPAVLGPYMAAIQKKPEFAKPWFDRLDLIFVALSPSTQEAVAIGPTAALLEDDSKAPVCLDWAGLARHQAFREIKHFSAQEGIAFEPTIYEIHGYDWEDFEKVDLQIIVLLHAHFRIVETYNPLAHSETVRGPAKAADLTRLLFWKRQGVPYELHHRKLS